MERIEIRTPAKINLCLYVLSNRDDGYHELETFMIPIGLYDELTITPWGDSIRTTSSTNPELNTKSNLAHRAAEAWLDASGIEMGLHIEIKKKIPIQAGLGGGSSDAAAVLRAMQGITPKPLSNEQLHHIASKLGADVPFFLSPGPRFARGIGELLGPPQLLGPLWLILAIAPFGLSTREVFEDFTIPLTFEHISVNDEPPRKWGFEELLRLMRNDLQPTAEEKHPEIARVRQLLKNAGAGNSCMSGSGPSVFSLFENEGLARQVMEKIDGNLGWTYLLLRAIT